ncbi:MAG: SDR family oxidoreductase [Thermoplasmata archaeon]|nr:SDR family oxidoreductase [Thermoplasmata archaeon]
MTDSETSPATPRRRWTVGGPEESESIPAETATFVPRTVVVTGATSGIGEATAHALARRVETLVLVGRDAGKLGAVAAALSAEHGGANVRTHVADLSRMVEVRRLAAELRASYPKLEVLVNNAGTYFSRNERTPEGIERTWALNVLSPFLLTRLLRPSLTAAAPSRVVNVASAAHSGARLRFDDLENQRRYSGFSTYGRSKLALILLTHAFAERWGPDHISVNALHPGFVRTRFGQDNRGVTAAVIRLAVRSFGISPERGAETSVFLATAPQVEGRTGEYYVRSRAVRSSRESYDAASGLRLWELCSAQVGLPASEEGL